ncbi:hypothetical protein [Saccharomonospora saliphila]|uniref:hypothetical protein n=1 Tax=Saccharomonospora saliphila TaxID=369829 RepID=UPI000363667C|nr:hypothetical protein [Saccharomonospora saliphila]
MTARNRRAAEGTSGTEPTIAAAKIARNATLGAAAIAAAATVATAVLTGPSETRGTATAADPGSGATRPATSRTAPGGSTATAPGTDDGQASSSPSSDADAVSLLDQPPVEGRRVWRPGEARVGHEQHSRVLTAEPGCARSRSTSYNVIPGMRSFHAHAAVTDDSISGSVDVTVLLDGEPARTVSVAPGDEAEVAVDLGSAFRFTVRVGSFCSEPYTVVLIDPVLAP